MDGFVNLAKNEQFKGSIFNGFSRDIANSARDCGLVDSCSPFYRSYLRAVRWLADQCELFYGDNQCSGVDNFIKDIMFGKISPNNEDYVVLNSHVPPNERSSAGPGIWLEEKTARLIREVQRDFDLRNDSKYFGQFTASCGRNLDEIRSQFYVDCYSECVQPQGSRMKANTTECVPVPSSEHVAEIVGKKGGKIKNIRAETNTYIKTPKRDEEPVFVITGRKEDVAFAKQKILAAAEHFSQLREARRQNPAGPAPSLGPPKREGDVTVSVEVPYEFVGLVVGQKGATIKRIQQDTNTYITTPSRRHRPIFEVVGQPCDVETAREAITAHITSRVDKFRGEAAGPGSSGGDSFGGSSGLDFLGMDEPAPFRPPAGEPPLFGGLGDANLGGTWTGAPPPPPPGAHKQPPPAFPTSADPLAGLSASLRGLTLPDSVSAAAGWPVDGRGRTASLPAADPADAPVGRRRSGDGSAPRQLGGLLFGLAPTLGWEGGPLPPARRASSKGSSETLNSDSGVETATPPPPLDGAVFGPIGSKRTSPTSLSGCSE